MPNLAGEGIGCDFAATTKVFLPLSCTYWRISTMESEAGVLFNVISATCRSKDATVHHCQQYLYHFLYSPSMYSTPLQRPCSHLLSFHLSSVVHTDQQLRKCHHLQPSIQQGGSCQPWIGFYVKEPPPHLQTQFITKPGDTVLDPAVSCWRDLARGISLEMVRY